MKGKDQFENPDADDRTTLNWTLKEDVGWSNLAQDRIQ
jgi:hypothetical protein